MLLLITLLKLLAVVAILWAATLAWREKLYVSGMVNYPVSTR